MEQSIIDFASQQEIFCGEFKRSLEAEVEKRHRDLSGLSASLGKMLDTQIQTVGKLSGLATDQLYAEQKWVTGYLTGQRKMLLTANNKVQALGQLQLAELATIA